MAERSRLRRLITHFGVAAVLLAGIGVFTVATGRAPSAHAATECGVTSWRSTGDVYSKSYPTKFVTYNVTSDLQQKYDYSFHVWCLGIRNKVTVSVNHSPHGTGWFNAWAANGCLGSLGVVGSGTITSSPGPWTTYSAALSRDTSQEVFQLSTTETGTQSQIRGFCGGHIAGQP